MPLQYLRCKVRQRNRDLLLSLKLIELNGKPMARFREELAERRRKDADQQAYQKRIARKKAEEQVKEVAEKLKSLNPGFDPGTVTPTIESGVVTGLQFPTDKVTDISPIQALPRLQRLSCKGSAPGKGKLENLQPLQGMTLTELEFDFKPQSNLAVLGSLKAMEKINGQPAAKFLADAKRQQEVARDRPKGTGQPSKTLRFIGQLVSDPDKTPRGADAEKVLTVRTTEAVLVPSAYHAMKVVKHRYQYLEALRDPNVISRLRRLQEAQYQIAKHQASLYTPVAVDHHIDVVIDATTKIRRNTLPPAWDAQGNTARFTKEEMDRMKGPDKKLPGYEAEFSALARKQFLEIYFTPAALAKPAEQENELTGNPRSRVKLIVILP
jgi:hypothetical protein